MKKFNSVVYTLLLANSLSINELPLNNRSSKWWDMFWYYLGLDEAKRYSVEA